VVGGLPTFGVWWLKKEGLRREIEKKEKSSFSFSYLLTLFFFDSGRATSQPNLLGLVSY